jgi:hypothetical protein
VTNEHNVHDADDGSGGNVAVVESPKPVDGSKFPPSWYPDPTHRFEFRYFNGERWTADVARQSNRYIDPVESIAPTFTAPPSRAMAVTALVFALCSLAIAWMPFLFVVGAAGAIVALVLGIIVLRRSRRTTKAGEPVAIGQGMAISALCCAVAALGLCVVGFQLTRVVLREVDELVNPGPHQVRIDSCESIDGHVVAEGSIRNRDIEAHDYTITIAYRLDGEQWETDSVRVLDVGPGDTTEFATSSNSLNFSTAAVTCTIEHVYGPPPFSN